MDAQIIESGHCSGKYDDHRYPEVLARMRIEGRKIFVTGNCRIPPGTAPPVGSGGAVSCTFPSVCGVPKGGPLGIPWRERS